MSFRFLKASSINLTLKSSSLLHVFGITIARVIGALTAVVSSLSIVSIYGHFDAGLYFLNFAIAYFIAQVVRFGGEVDILSSEKSTERKLIISNLFSVSSYIALFLIIISFIAFLYAGEGVYLIVVFSGVLIAFVEFFSDILKKYDNPILGTILFSTVIHLIIFLFTLTKIFNSLELMLLFASLASLVIVLIVYFKRQSFSLLRIIIPKVSKSSLQACMYNLVNFASAPIFLAGFIYIYGASLGADFRVSLRISTLVLFSFMAFQQYMLRKNILDNFSHIEIFNVFRRNRNTLLLPSSLILAFGVLFFAYILVYLDYFGIGFLWMSLIWILSFLIGSFASFATVYCVKYRYFNLIFKSRLISMIFVLLGGGGVYYLSLNWYYFTVVMALFYCLPHYLNYFNLKRSMREI